MTSLTPSGVPRINRGQNADIASIPTETIILFVEGVMTTADIEILRDMVTDRPGMRASIWEFVRSFLYITVPLSLLFGWLPAQTDREFWLSLACLILGIILAGSIEPIFLRRALREQKTEATQMGFELNQKGLVYRQANYQVDVDWHALTSVVREPSWIIAKFGSLASFAIPTRFFQTVVERDVWLARFAEELGPDRPIENRLVLDL